MHHLIVMESKIVNILSSEMLNYPGELMICDLSHAYQCSPDEEMFGNATLYIYETVMKISSLKMYMIR